jgi:hypothetical protein
MVIFRSVAAAIGLFALGLQFWLMAQYPDSRSLVTTAIKFFSYFTILTNTLVALSMLLPLIAPNSMAGRGLSKPSVRTATACYSVIVATVYFVLLRNVGGDERLELVADRLLHYITPVMFTIDWLAFVPRGQVRWTTIATSLILPILYGLWTLAHGAVTGWYPYRFFNVARIGYLHTFTNFAVFISMFTVVALGFVVLDRVLARFKQQRSSL